MSIPAEFLLIAAASLAVVLVLLATEQWVVRLLDSRLAKHPDLAVPLPNHNSLVRWTVRRLVRARAVRDTSHGHYYLVTDGYAAYRRRGRTAIIVALAASGAVVWLSGFLQ